MSQTMNGITSSSRHELIGELQELVRRFTELRNQSSLSLHGACAMSDMRTEAAKVCLSIGIEIPEVFSLQPTQIELDARNKPPKIKSRKTAA